MFSPFSVVELPSELVLVLSAVIGVLVVEGLKVVGGWFGKDLSGWAAGLSAAIVSLVVLFANDLLSLVPVEYEAVVAAILNVLVVLLGMFGLHRQVKRIGSVRR